MTESPSPTCPDASLASTGRVNVSALDLEFPELTGKGPETTKATPANLGKFFASLVSGVGTISTSAAVAGLDPKTIRRWRKKSGRFDEMVAQLKGRNNATYEQVVHGAATQDDDLKLATDSAKWLLSKHLPDTFGDKSRIEVAPANMTPEKLKETMVERLRNPTEEEEEWLAEAGWVRKGE